jgi:RNA polymerase sigma-70 factor (ECF subfamily)
MNTLALAVPRQFMDNKVHEEFEDFLMAVGIVDRGGKKASPWGAVDGTVLADLIERSRRGDLQAMESLYGLFKRPVFGLAYRHTMNQAAAEDLLQDVFVKIFVHIGDVRDAETFPAWVFRIALNTCYSHLRQKRAQGDREVSLTDIEGTLTEQDSGDVERDLKEPLEQAIQSLAPRLKSVFVLHDVQGYKHEEIARLIGCSVGTSKSQLFKARLRLRAYLKTRDLV